ncbi:MAG TPA: HD domain-containing protein [Candidatus Baltobacteraceae bacterium]|nr:HD domain-containing protein [Candidatus Baltobacteraceae bacterium]
MKSHFINDLADGQVVASLFLVREKEVRTSQRTGTSWLHLELADRTGTIAAKMWENYAPLAATFECDDVVQIRGRVKLYNGRKELTLEQIIPALEHDYDLGDFLAHTKYDVEELYSRLHQAIAGMKNPWLKRLLTDIVEDPAIAPKLKRAPAAMTMHHAYIGGLLEHVVSLIGLSSAVSAHYPQLDADLLLAGVVLHDIGKLDELRYTRAIDYSSEGRLLGHITIGVTLVREKRRAIPGFPEPLGLLLEHMILSHHGSYEFGSPSLPQIPEALALHFVDDLDSKMAGAYQTLNAAGGDDVWSERNPSLRRALLRAKPFLNDGAPNAATTATLPFGDAKDADKR